MHNSSSHRKTDVKVYDSSGNVITLYNLNTVQKTIERDSHSCKGCGSNESLSILQLSGAIEGISQDIFPKELHAVLCGKCRERFQTLRSLSVSQHSNSDNDFWLRIVHKGVVPAIIHLEESRYRQ